MTYDKKEIFEKETGVSVEQAKSVLKYLKENKNDNSLKNEIKYLIENKNPFNTKNNK